MSTYQRPGSRKNTWHMSEFLCNPSGNANVAAHPKSKPPWLHYGSQDRGPWLQWWRLRLLSMLKVTIRGERVSECVCVLGRGENPRFWRDQNETKIYSAASSSSLGSIIWIIRLTLSIGVFKLTVNFSKGQVKEVNNTDVKAVHGGFYVVKISANGRAENIGRSVQTWRHGTDLCVWRCL